MSQTLPMTRSLGPTKPPAPAVKDSGKDEEMGDVRVGDVVERHPSSIAAGLHRLLSDASQRDRLLFIAKALSLLFAQLLISIVVICLFVFVPSLFGWVIDNAWSLPTAWGMAMGFLIVLACVPGVTRSFPCNWLCVLMFALLEGFLLGVMCARWDTDVLLIAAVVTTVVVVGLIAFALQTRINFTRWCVTTVKVRIDVHTDLAPGRTGMLLTLALVLICFGFLAIVFASRIATMAYACLGVLVFSLFIVHDVQVIMSGGHRYEFGEDDYVFASMTLYLDIINLFLFTLLFCTGQAEKEDG